MLTHDHLPHGSGTVELAERETHSLRAGLPRVVDAFTLLDPRSRQLAIAAADAPRGRYLSVEDGATVRLIPLTHPITHIGRGLVADVRLEDPHVSRRHAIVALRGESVRVLDDRSSGGTFVNGRPVTVAELADGDVVRIGRAVFRYVELAHDAVGETDGDLGSTMTGRDASAAARPLRRFPIAPARRRTLRADSLRRTAVG